MNPDSSFPAAAPAAMRSGCGPPSRLARFGSCVSTFAFPRRTHKHGRRLIVALVLVAFGLFAASAEAHTGTATTACSTSGNTVTFNWTAFANPAGHGNGGQTHPGGESFTPPRAGRR